MELLGKQSAIKLDWQRERMEDHVSGLCDHGERLDQQSQDCHITDCRSTGDHLDETLQAGKVL